MKKLFLLIIIMNISSIANVAADDIYLECKGFGVAKPWKTPFLIVRSQNNQNETKKVISVGFSLLDIGYSKKPENEFTVSKGEWHGSLYFRDLEFDITPEFYHYDDPNRHKYYWEELDLRRTDLAMGYWKFDRNYRIDSKRVGYGCDAVSKSDFKESIQKIINRGWKKGIKAEAKRLKKIEEKEKELENRII